jgi:hypothetical protein
MTFEIFKPFKKGNIFVDEYYVKDTNGRFLEYNIKGLHSLINSSKRDFSIPESVGFDLNLYGIYLFQKKEIWGREEDKRIKVERCNCLRLNIGKYGIK